MSDQRNSGGELIRLGALWNPRGDSKAFLTGSINGDCRIVILKNKFKEQPNHPDYHIYIAKAERKEAQERPPSRPATRGNGGAPMREPGDDFDDDPQF